MAKPDCDDGWYKKSIELEAALDFADFTKPARVVLRYTFLQIFGRGTRPRFAVLSSAKIAARVGQPRQVIRRGREELVASGVLAPCPGIEDGFLFVKDYERWVVAGRHKGGFLPTTKPRLSRAEIADCKEAPDLSKTYIEALGIPRGDIQMDVTATSRWTPERHLDGPAPDIQMDVIPLAADIPMDVAAEPLRCQGDIQMDVKTSPPYVPPIRKRDLERERESSSTTSSGECAEGAARTTTDLPEVGSSPVGKRLAEWVQSLYREHEYGEVFDPPAAKVIRNWLRSGRSPEWCAQAFQAAIDKKSTEPHRYADRVLRELVARQEAGEMVIAPAFCDFVADPSAPAPAIPAAAPAAKLTKPQRDVAQAVRYAESLRKRFASMEASDGQG